MKNLVITVSIIFMAIIVFSFHEKNVKTNRLLLVNKWQAISVEFENPTLKEKEMTDEGNKKIIEKIQIMEFLQDGGFKNFIDGKEPAPGKHGRRKILSWKLLNKSKIADDNGAIIALDYLAENGEKLLLNGELFQ